MATTTTLADQELARFHAKTVADDAGECVLWVGARNEWGYGQFSVKRRTHRAHRLAYEQWRGPIPAGLHLDHLCRNRACVNPWHLEPVTKRENTLRGQTFAARQLAQTHCRRGHPFDATNTRMEGGTHRRCRACHRENEQTRRDRGHP